MGPWGTRVDFLRCYILRRNGLDRTKQQLDKVQSAFTLTDRLETLVNSLDLAVASNPGSL